MLSQGSRKIFLASMEYQVKVISLKIGPNQYNLIFQKSFQRILDKAFGKLSVIFIQIIAKRYFVFAVV